MPDYSNIFENLDEDDKRSRAEFEALETASLEKCRHSVEVALADFLADPDGYCEISKILTKTCVDLLNLESHKDGAVRMAKILLFLQRIHYEGLIDMAADVLCQIDDIAQAKHESRKHTNPEMQ